MRIIKKNSDSGQYFAGVIGNNFMVNRANDESGTDN
jgi:hypothetical protein